MLPGRLMDVMGNTGNNTGRQKQGRTGPQDAGRDVINRADKARRDNPDTERRHSARESREGEGEACNRQNPPGSPREEQKKERTRRERGSLELNCS